MIKLVIFDMDGVLVDARELHYQALNKALIENGYPGISREDQERYYEALPTTRKLQIYSERQGLNPEVHRFIALEKQKHTMAMVAAQLRPDQAKIDMLRSLQNEGYRVFVASNAVRESVDEMLKATGLYDYVELRLSNQDVEQCKPHPEIYQKAMEAAGVKPYETLIVEDSLPGRMAAVHSGAWLCDVAGPAEVTYYRVKGQIDMIAGRHVPVPKINVLIPMAGAGSRFAQAGYTFPKPLIEVHGKPMIRLVVENLAAEGQYTFVVRNEHYQQYALKYFLPLLAPGCNVVQVDALTEGAACTTLLAREYINDNRPLLIANSDQFMDWDARDFYRRVTASDADGAILTFRSTHPKWSYVKVNADGYVTELAEKKPISDIATVGIYYWRRGSDYVKYADQMIAANERVNGEFYVAPVYNRAIADGKKIITYDVTAMWGLGTPEDLTHFLAEHRK